MRGAREAPSCSRRERGPPRGPCSASERRRLASSSSPFAVTPLPPPPACMWGTRGRSVRDGRRTWGASPTSPRGPHTALPMRLHLQTGTLHWSPMQNVTAPATTAFPGLGPSPAHGCDCSPGHVATDTYSQSLFGVDTGAERGKPSWDGVPGFRQCDGCCESLGRCLGRREKVRGKIRTVSDNLNWSPRCKWKGILRFLEGAQRSKDVYREHRAHTFQKV